MRAALQYNFQGAKRTLTTAFNLERWNYYLKDYNDIIVTAFLQYGWPINHSADQLPRSKLQNHPSARENPALLRDYIAKELQYKAVIGPFQCNPFSTDCVISPLQSVAKRDSSVPRVVHDLSFPPGQSVNHGIARDEYLNQPFHLRLPGVDRLVEVINLKGPGCLVFKKGLKRAYRQIPVDPHDYHLLGMCIEGQFYFHTVMPFGLRSATLACQRTTKAVSYILNEEGILVDVYIDDFYGADTPELAEHSFDRMTQLFLELGLQSWPDKDTPPTHEMTCLGVCVNTLNMTLTVPDFRLEELQDLLSLWLHKTHFSKRELQQLLGKLAFVTACVRPGRAFSCRLINALRSCFARPRHQQYPVSAAIRGDLVWWKHFLQHYNGVSVIPTNVPVSNPDLFACDACLGACGAVCFGEFFHAPFPPFIASQNLNINQLELLTILVSLKLWQDRLRGCTIEILTDNKVSVYALTYQRSSDHFMQCCLREIWLLLALNNIHLFAHHICGKTNVLADSLSRYHLAGTYAAYVEHAVTSLDLRQVFPDDSMFAFTAY